MRKTEIGKFLKLAEEIPIIDVRSPSEFIAGHIPSAFNIPLFDDREREIVGTIYKEQGRNEAVIEGIKLSGPAMHLKLEKALEVSKGKKLLLHCWRGGMRSEAMAWLFSLVGIDSEILEGGYKAYRNFILSSFTENKKMIILGGLTGSGKTEILRYLSQNGQQVIDLEGLSNHKGSAFGYLSQMPQPTSEHFANILFEEWRKIDGNKTVWLEDESKNIGTVFMPGEFYQNMQNKPVIVLIMDLKTRIPRLLEEYSNHSKNDLIAAVRRISKRLGGDNTKEAIDSIEKDDFSKAIEITLKYYDKAYKYGLRKKEGTKVIYLKTDTDNFEINAGKILEAARSIPGINL